MRRSELMSSLEESKTDSDDDPEVFVLADADETIPIRGIHVDQSTGEILIEPESPMTTDDHIKELAERFFEEYARENGYKKPSEEHEADESVDGLRESVKSDGRIDWNKPTSYDFEDFTRDFFLGGGFNREQFDAAVVHEPHWLHCARENGWADTEVSDGFSESLRQTLEDLEDGEKLEDYVIRKTMS